MGPLTSDPNQAAKDCCQIPAKVRTPENDQPSSSVETNHPLHTDQQLRDGGDGATHLETRVHVYVWKRGTKRLNGEHITDDALRKAGMQPC